MKNVDVSFYGTVYITRKLMVTRNETLIYSCFASNLDCCLKYLKWCKFNLNNLTYQCIWDELKFKYIFYFKNKEDMFLMLLSV